MNYFDPPHGGRPPSDEAVHAATVRYVEWGRKNGITPSPEWEAKNSPDAQKPLRRTGEGGARSKR